MGSKAKEGHLDIVEFGLVPLSVSFHPHLPKVRRPLGAGMRFDVAFDPLLPFFKEKRF